MPSVTTLHFGPFHLEGTDNELWRGPRRCHLKAKAVAVLRYLVEHPGRLVRKSDLLAAIWPDVAVSEWVLTTCIREIRHVLGDSVTTPRYIATVHRQGYRFIAPVTVGETSPPPVPAAPPTPEVLLSAPPPTLLTEEYKPVTVLCGALGEAAALAARLGAEPWYRVLQQVVRLAQEVLERYDGTLLPPPNLGFTAVFGAPVAQEDHARRAVLAAMELGQRLHAAPLPTQLGGDGVALRLGLHSGLVVVGYLGDDAHRIALAVGEPVAVATRLQQCAAPGTLLVSAATYALVREEVRGEPCGRLTLDGQQAPLPVYAVQGLVQRRAGVPQRTTQVRSPFVGRQRELALLHDRLEAVRTGAGQAVSLVGPPGIGKTRLLTEFARSLSPDQVTWALGHCLAYGQAMSYLPVRDVVRQVGALNAGDPLETPTAAVRRWLAALGEAAEEDVAVLCQLLDLPVPREALARLSPEARQARTLTLLWHLLQQEAQQRPLVLAGEDVHWMDPTSATWLTALVDRLAGMAVLLLLTQRPGYQPPWGAHAAVTQVALPPLRTADSQAIAAAVPGAAQLPAAQCQQIVAHGAGNPFFVEELAWHAVEHGQATTPVPETVYAVLAACIDRLPPEPKALLQTAAVIGTEVLVALLQAVAEVPEEVLRPGLSHLQAAEFLDETRLLPEIAFTFKHALTQQVAYETLLQERRRALHARVVEAMEALAGDRLAEQVDQLAYHALRGEVWAKAVTYCQQAGARAFDREAVAAFEQALQALAHLPEDDDTRGLALELRLALGRALRVLGEHGRCLALLGEAEALARALDDRARLGRVLAQRAHVLRLTGDLDSAIAAGQQACTLAATLGDSALQGQTSLNLEQVYTAIGDFGRAAALLRQNVAAERASERLSTDVRIESRAWLARTLASLGEFTEGRRHGEEALRLATVDGGGATPIIAHGCLGFLYLAHGDLEHAIRVYDQGLVRCRASGYRGGFLRPIMVGLGYAAALQGRLVEGRALLEEAIREGIQTGGLQSSLASGVALLSEVCRLAGRGEEAWQHARQALDLARQQQARGNEALALHQLGTVHAHADPPDAEPAEVHYQQALALADELGMRPLQAHCHRGLGTLYAAAGQREQAGSALTTAIAMYQSMEMTFWLPETEAALVQVEKR